MIQNLSSIKYKSRFSHTGVDSVVVKIDKFIPFCTDNYSMGVSSCEVGVRMTGHKVGFLLRTVWKHGEFHHNLFFSHFWIIDGEVSSFIQEVFCNIDGS